MDGRQVLKFLDFGIIISSIFVTSVTGMVIDVCIWAKHGSFAKVSNWLTSEMTSVNLAIHSKD